MPLPLTPIIAQLPATVPFVGPEALERRNGRALKVRLGANESPFGVSPIAAAAMRDAVDEVWQYNDPEAHDLKAALAGVTGVDAGQVHVGAGIDEILGDLVRILASPGDAIVTSFGSYPTFNYHVQGYGARLIEVPYVDDAVDLEHLAGAAVEHAARLVYLANPDNPMGTWRSGADIAALLDQLPDDCVLLVDEAYADFAPPEAALPDSEDPRLVRTRTFSKAHGMAGARVGYALGHVDLVGALNRIRNQFGVNRLAQVGALASLGDGAFLTDVVHQVAEGRQDMIALADELGLRHVPSATNFVNIDMGSGDAARSTLQKLLERDVFVRMPGRPPGDRCIRVTVGTAQQRADFAQALRDIVRAS